MTYIYLIVQLHSFVFITNNHYDTGKHICGLVPRFIFRFWSQSKVPVKLISPEKFLRELNTVCKLKNHDIFPFPGQG